LQLRVVACPAGSQGVATHLHSLRKCLCCLPQHARSCTAGSRRGCCIDDDVAQPMPNVWARGLARWFEGHFGCSGIQMSRAAEPLSLEMARRRRPSAPQTRQIPHGNLLQPSACHPPEVPCLGVTRMAPDGFYPKPKTLTIAVEATERDVTPSRPVRRGRRPAMVEMGQPGGTHLQVTAEQGLMDSDATRIGARLGASSVGRVHHLISDAALPLPNLNSINPLEPLHTR
jgi:hypothetical protein